jgi:omega-6 fatty acid desaturase (delta-12 desaturase)
MTTELIKKTIEYAKEEPKKTWTHFLETILVLTLFIAGTLPYFPIWMRVISSFFAGFTLVRVFIFYHDTLHGAIFRKSKLGKSIMDFVGILILNPPQVWKRSHNYHHQHNAQIATASIGSFPVLTVEQYQQATPLKRFYYLLSRSGFVMFFGYFFIFMIGMCLKSFLTDPKRHSDSLIALVFHFSIIALLVYFFNWNIAILSFIFPIFVASAFGAYLFYLQHNFPDVKLKPRTEWDYVFAALYSSSMMEGNSVIHWFTGNIGYHHVHHLNSTIPFYKLPIVMKAIPELQTPGRTSLSIRDMFKNLSLKLWDPAQNQMVPLTSSSLKKLEFSDNFSK